MDFLVNHAHGFVISVPEIYGRIVRVQGKLEVWCPIILTVVHCCRVFSRGVTRGS